jgi:cytochrome c oxidase assembly protein subunit 15
MDADHAALRRKLALAAALAVLIVVAASAYLRLAQAGFSCADWPACYGRVSENAARLASSETVFWVRVAHRIAALAISIAVLLLVYLGWRERKPRPAGFHWALAALALTAFLAALGRWTPGARLPAITLGNLLAGFALLMVLWRIVRGTQETRLSLAAMIVLLLFALQVSLGGLLSTRFAGPACPSYPGCGAKVEFSRDAFNPFEPVVVANDGPSSAQLGQTGLVMAHRSMALLLAFAVALLAWRGWRQGGAARSRALALLALLGLEYGLGVGVALSTPPLLLVFAHNVTAALLLLLIAESGTTPGSAPAPASARSAP